MLPVERLVGHRRRFRRLRRRFRMLRHRSRKRLLVLLLAKVLRKRRLRVWMLKHRTRAQTCLLLLVFVEEAMLNVFRVRGCVLRHRSNGQLLLLLSIVRFVPDKSWMGTWVLHWWIAIRHIAYAVVRLPKPRLCTCVRWCGSRCLPVRHLHCVAIRRIGDLFLGVVRHPKSRQLYGRRFWESRRERLMMLRMVLWRARWVSWRL